MPGRGQHSEASATLDVDGRPCAARPMRGSGAGHAEGLATVARTVDDVLEACRWMPGRVLVLCAGAITPESSSVIARSARLATFAAIVVVAQDVTALARMGAERLPVPAVVVTRAEDRALVCRATQVSVGVQRWAGEPARTMPVGRPERRRSTAAP